MNHIEAIFFDFDGVLLDTEPVHYRAWSDVLRPLGIEFSWERYRDHYIGIDDREMLHDLLRFTGSPRAWDELWAQYPAKKRLFQERAQHPVFEPELKAMLPSLAASYRLAVVSSSAFSEIEPLLVNGGVRPYFGTVVGGDHVKNQKPAPEPYLLAAQRLGVSRALILEDSLAGQAAGRAAGFEVVPVKHPSEVPGLLRTRLGLAAGV